MIRQPFRTWPAFFVIHAAIICPLAFAVWLKLFLSGLTAIGLDTGTSMAHVGDDLAAGIILVIVFVMCSYCLWLGWLVIFVQISMSRYGGDGQLSVRPLIGKWTHVDLEDLAGYSLSSAPDWFDWFVFGYKWDRGGVVLYPKTGRPIELGSLTMSQFPKLLDLLDESGAQYFGKETRWWFPHRKSKFKYDPF